MSAMLERVDDPEKLGTTPRGGAGWGSTGVRK